MITWKKHFLYQIDYQHWANDILFSALDRLDDAARRSDQGLFFGSIQQTLNHMLAGHLAWWSRCKGESPETQAVMAQEDWGELKNSLRSEVRNFQHWLERQPDEFFEGSLAYPLSSGATYTNWLRDILSHMLTQMAHHRSQVAAVATRLGAPLAEMDYILYKREMQDSLSHLRHK